MLHEPISSGELRGLQTQILQDSLVRQIIHSQRPDGWFGNCFHGYDSLEAGIRVLCEKGVSPEHPALARALLGLEIHADRITQQMGKVGGVLDEWGFGGTSMMRAAVFAYAGIEDKELVQDQIQAALDGLRAILEVESVSEITESYQGKLAFKAGVKWPGIYHLRLLAFTESWRNPQAQQIVEAALSRLIELSPLPDIYVRDRGQLIAPASFAMHDFNPSLLEMTEAEWMMWFHRIELLARLGVVGAIQGLCRQVEGLCEMLDQGGGWFTHPVSHNYFKHWGAYTGLMLERDWRLRQRRIFDLTFRSLLICHYSGI